ncbi:DHH family phosphoesterase [Urbifossiella limnaea]|uniref:Putative manganese-dependent inorganic pyrophosphatase n=1 Tax=Urbifossiella limnaea TaxID=2528023 RepID=A0A517XS78_9BACT|nr:DHH family phosphoesterase [Urbifossiella limnaea]QDU20343.1 putative manganese-dependent inorganic pyrophosphatase [Urbifossiella limnaea]
MARSSADPEGVTRSGTVGIRRSHRFLSGLKTAERVVFVSHVQPDPDSLGSMLGLAHLVEQKLGKPTLITRDGLISRAENRAMVKVLNLHLTKVEDVDWRPGDAVVMVDSQPNTGRHTLPEDAPLYAVIDHHDTPGDLDNVPFTDIRASHGATCTVVTKYLREQDCDIPEKLATALLYGIETEMAGFPREANPADDDALIFLYPLADKDQIAQIRNARLPHSHFECLLQALQSSFIYDNLIISWVDDLPQPEQAAEVVDFMIRFDQVDWAVCGGVYKDQLILSVRAAMADARSGDILRQVVGKLGKAGGHDRRAGGSIRLTSTAPSAVDELQAELRRRFLKALKIDDTRGRRLVPLREMLQNLQS